ncbi:M24 family metallopeptidase [bacterium]|nr:M24 family metallopeptidase [bacterium]
MPQGEWKRVAERLHRENATALLVNDPPHLSWLTGFRGSAGVLLVTVQGAFLCVDSRYGEVAGKMSGEGLAVVEAPLAGNLLKTALEVASPSLGEGPIGYLPRFVSGEVESRWADTIAQEIVSADQWVLRIRAVKSPNEEEGIRESARLNAALFRHLMGLIAPGVSERKLASEVVRFALEEGAESMAFDPIVASGPLSSRPHACFTDRVIGGGEPLTVDLGVMVDGWASDMTRTWAVPGAPPSGLATEIHHIVLDALLLGIERAEPGARCKDVDGASRDLIGGAGYGEAFGHSLGHGLGRECHESPHVSQKEEMNLESGMVITIEPGIYLPGQMGVRIEDTVVVGREDSVLGDGVPREFLAI